MVVANTSIRVAWLSVVTAVRIGFRVVVIGNVLLPGLRTERNQMGTYPAGQNEENLSAEGRIYAARRSRTGTRNEGSSIRLRQGKVARTPSPFGPFETYALAGPATPAGT